MGRGFPTGTSQYPQKKCSRTGNPYFQVVFPSHYVCSGSRLSQITLGPPLTTKLNDVELPLSINIQPEYFHMVILRWTVPLRHYSTRSFEGGRYYPKMILLTSLMRLQRKVWMDFVSGNVPLPLPKSSVQGYQSRDGV